MASKTAASKAKAKASSKKPAREIDPLTPQEVKLLIELCSRRSPTGIRNRALLALLYGSGLRISEALALRPKDVSLDGGSKINVHNGKGAKRRTCALLPDSVAHLQRWLDKRASLPGVTARKPIFCTLSTGRVGDVVTKPGGPLSSAYVRGWLARLAKKAKANGLHKRIHAHGFRHSHATQLRKRGWDVVQIQKQLGHASLSVTGVYLDHIGAHELVEQMQGEDWGL